MATGARPAASATPHALVDPGELAGGPRYGSPGKAPEGSPARPSRRPRAASGGGPPAGPLSSGIVIGAIRQLRWSDIDLEGGVERSRAEHEKTGFEHYTPVTAEALAVLEGAKERSFRGGDTPPVLPASTDASGSSNGGNPGRIQGPRQPFLSSSLRGRLRRKFIWSTRGWSSRRRTGSC